MSAKPVCVACQRFYRPKKNGTAFIEAMPRSSNHLPMRGPEHADEWKPYKLWHGDTWACTGCGHEIIVGTPANPLAWQHEDHFDRLVESFKPKITVNDC